MPHAPISYWMPPKNVLAPVLGGGRFMQPGADGGDCSDLSYA